MRIFILTLGTRGDLEPFWAMGRSLQARGHAVTIGTSEFHIKKDPSVTWVNIGNSTQAEFIAFLRSLAAEPDRLERTMAFGRRWAMPQVAFSMKTIASLAMQHDYFMGNLKFPLTRGGVVLPGAYVTYDPPPSLDAAKANGSHTHEGRTLELVAMNRELIDPQHEWDEYFHFTGFWQPLVDKLPRPSDLEGFLATGSAPVVLTMGSMVMFDPQKLADCFFKALELCDLRGIIVGGWSDQRCGMHPSGRMMTVKEADYSWLFEHAACVVHHGGVGTVASVLRAGIPSVLLPQIPSQERWGAILEREGLCAGVLDTASLEPDQLAAALRRAIQDLSLRQSAQQWRTRLNRDTSIARAADLIEAHWAKLCGHGGV